MPVRTRTQQQLKVTLALAFLSNGVPVLLSVVHEWSRHPAPVFLWGAAISTVAPIVVAVAQTWWRPLRWVLQYGGILGLTMMQAYTGGVFSPYVLLLVAPSIWFGLTLTGGELRAALLVVTACCVLPMVVVGPPAYPVNVLAALVAIIATSGVIGSLAYLSRETERLTARLSHEATHDRLTHLMNRRGWEEETERALRATRPGAPLCVLLIDLDGLKQINDSAGHDEGDRAIRETGDRLRAAFGTEAAVARLGGDEFAVLIVGSSVDAVLGRLARLRGVTPPEGAFSAGIAVITDDEELGDAMRRADLALYEVKKTGRGRDLLASAPVDLAIDGHSGAGDGDARATGDARRQRPGARGRSMT